MNFSHTWTIKDFSRKMEQSSLSSKIGSNDSCYSYEAFPKEDEHKFALFLFPNGKTKESKGYLSLYLMNTNVSTLLPTVECKFAILNDKENKCNVREIKKKLYSRYCHVSNDQKEMGFERFISRGKLFEPSNGFLPKDKLTIFVEISYLIDKEKTVIASCNPTSIVSASECQVLEDYAKLLASGDLSDVVLAVSGTEFAAHKAILATRSPGFCAKHDLMEKQQNRVEITDVKIEVFQQLLSYIYTGKCDSIEGNAEELLAAADKYQLLELKSLSEQYLCTKVSVKTAPNLLLLAEKHNADKLKTAAQDFMKRYDFLSKSNVKSDRIQAMFMANPELLFSYFGK